MNAKCYYRENVILLLKCLAQKIQEKAKLFGNGDGLKHIQIKQCNDSGQYKLITILEDSGEIKYIRSSVAHPDQHTPKVIIGGIPKPIVLYDKEAQRFICAFFILIGSICIRRNSTCLSIKSCNWSQRNRIIIFS